MSTEPDFRDMVAAIVNGKAYPVGIAPDGVVRFQPHKWVSAALVEKMREWDEYLASQNGPIGRIPTDMYTPNDLFRDLSKGIWTTDETIAYDTNGGFSVSGMCDRSTTSTVEVIYIDNNGKVTFETYLGNEEGEDAE